MTRALGLLSTSERRILHHFVRVQPHHEELVGIGIEPSPQHTYPRHQQDPSDVIPAEDDLPGDAEPAAEEPYLSGRGAPFRRRHRLYGPIALYGGRVEPDNGCQEMLEYFRRLRLDRRQPVARADGREDDERCPTSPTCARPACWPSAIA
jgi:hypothetical protein